MGNTSAGFFVEEVAPPEIGGGENAFMLNTPTRTFPLLAETSEEKVSWIAVLRAAIEAPVDAYCKGASANGSYDSD